MDIRVGWLENGAFGGRGRWGWLDQVSDSVVCMTWWWITLI